MFENPVVITELNIDEGTSVYKQNGPAEACWTGNTEIDASEPTLAASFIATPSLSCIQTVELNLLLDLTYFTFPTVFTFQKSPLRGSACHRSVARKSHVLTFYGKFSPFCLIN